MIWLSVNFDFFIMQNLLRVVYEKSLLLTPVIFRGVEHNTLALKKTLGIRVAPSFVMDFGLNQSVFLTRRFDVIDSIRWAFRRPD